MLSRWAFAVACAALMGGCVTEREGPAPRGVPVRPASTGSTIKADRPVLPSGPVATPAAALSSNAAVAATLFPLGQLVYDGQSLPLASPDGRFVAVQSGEPPTWPTILAEDAATPVNRTTLTIFDVSGSAVRLLSPPQPLPNGLMLGRAADAEGFLVESPQRDGSRWIGRVHWLTGETTWLAKDGKINAHATLLPNGNLVFTRREVGSARNELVLFSSEGEAVLAAEEGTSYWFPISSGEASLVYVLRLHAAGTDLEALRVEGGNFGGALFRRHLSPSTDPLLAHQMGMTAAPLGSSRGGSLTCLSPRHGRAGVLDISTGLFEPLAPRALAAIASPDPASPGYFCSTPDALVFVPKIGTGAPAGAPVAVLPSPYVARAAWSDPPSLLLVGPSRNAPDRLELLRLVLKQ